MDAEDVGAGEDGGYVGGCSRVDTVCCRGDFAVKEKRQRGILAEGVGEEAFAGGSDEDGEIELVELVEVGEDGVVFIEFLAEAQAGVEDDPVAGDARCGGGFEAFFELGNDERENFAGSECRKRGPVLGAGSGVHEDGATTELGASGGHVGVPEVATDVVDDLGSGFDGVAGGGGVEGVDGEDCFGMVLPDCLDDWECAGLLFACC